MSESDSIATMLRRASALREAGRFEEASVAYRALLSVEPALPDCWYNLGWVERRLGRGEAALAAYEEAIRRGVRDIEEVFVNRGVILLDDLNRVDAAEREFRSALEVNARYTPALLNLANLEEDRGARPEAEMLYRRVLEIEPEHWEGLARYANSRATFTTTDDIIARLRLALARHDVEPSARASLGFALGRALDIAGDYRSAFGAYVAANRASTESAPKNVQPYNSLAHERYVDALIAAFAQPVQPDDTDGNPPAVFICGMFRSGSTLLEQALGGHARVTAGGEIPTLPMLAGELAPFPDSISGIGPDRRKAIAAAYRDSVDRLYPDADLLTDKRPDNFLLIGLAKLIFPTAKILHSVRDPVDTCLSTFFLHLDHGMSYARDMDHIAHYYRQYRRLMTHWKRLYPGDIHDFDYDRFVREPRATLEPALQFCGLDWDDSCLSFHQRKGLVRTASVWQVREPLYQRASGRSRVYANEVSSLREALSDYYPPAS